MSSLVATAVGGTGRIGFSGSAGGVDFVVGFLDRRRELVIGLLGPTPRSDSSTPLVVNFLTTPRVGCRTSWTDAASWSLNLTIGPPGEVLRRLDVELWPGVKLRLGRERFLCVALAARTAVLLPVSLPCVARVIPEAVLV